jgi:hypothetical protein
MAIRRQDVNAGINLGSDPDLPDPRVLTWLPVRVDRRPTTNAFARTSRPRLAASAPRSAIVEPGFDVISCSAQSAAAWQSFAFALILCDPI